MKTNIELDIGNDVLDIPTMASLSDESYRSHVMDEQLFWIDHHDILRVKHVGFPLATNKVQLDILIEVLKAQRHKLADAY